MSKFQSVKLYEGFSACFRQWRAEGTHCKFLHGYGVSFRVWFTGDLDAKNWVYDFGGLKRSDTRIDDMRPDEWLKWLLDHTVLVAQDDPYLEMFKKLDTLGIIQLRIMKDVGAERFAEFLAKTLDTFVRSDTNGRVRVARLEFYEQERNSAVVELPE